MTTHASETDQQSARDRAAQVGGTAKEQTGQVAATAKEQAAGVAGTAKEQAVDVAQDAADQARNLLEELRRNVRDQVGTQRSRLAETLDSYADELRRMAESSESDGPATEAVRQIAGRLRDMKDYLAGDHDVAGDVRRFARRRPGTFLLACAAAGVLAGRATRGATAARRQEQGGARHVGGVREPGTPGDVAEYRSGSYAGTGGYGTGNGPGYGTGNGTEYGTGYAGGYGTGTAAADPLSGVQQTSDPNLRATSGPLAGDDRTAGYRDAQGAATGPTGYAEPVAPDPGPGPTGVDEDITAASRAARERGER